MTGAAELAHLAGHVTPHLTPHVGSDPGDEVAARVRLAARTTNPDVLATLAEDAVLTVRAAVALNPAYAQAANLRLVRDTDIRVRTLLAGKVARLLPGLSGREHRAAQAHVHQMLQTLADDVADRVRCCLAEALVAMPDAPRDIILKLARDPVSSVSDPVVRLSPLLTDADLLELLATPPPPRDAGLDRQPLWPQRRRRPRHRTPRQQPRRRRAAVQPLRLGAGSDARRPSRPRRRPPGVA